MADDKAVIAEICAGAPPEIRACIRKYKLAPNTEFETLTNQFKSLSPDELVSALEYLNTPNLRPDLSEYTKPGLIFFLITRLQGLFSETCGTCKLSYRSKFNEPALLSCDNCSQEVHHTCLAQLLDIPEDELTKDTVTAALNPLKLDEWTYICKPCKLQADSSSGYVKKNILKKQMKSANQASSASTTPDDSGPAPLQRL